MNLIAMGKPFVLVFFTQSTQLSWLLEHTRYVYAYEALLFAIPFHFFYYLFVLYM